MASYDAYKAEEQRQATIMAKAAKRAMDEAAKEFELPMLNAFLGAMVGLEIEALSAIEDGKMRRSMIVAMDKQRRIGLREALSKQREFAQVAQLGGRDA